MVDRQKSSQIQSSILEEGTCSTVDNSSNSLDIVAFPTVQNDTLNIVKFAWNEKEVGMLQSAYFIGYMGTMVIGANLILGFLGQFKGILVLLVLNFVTFLTCK